MKKTLEDYFKIHGTFSIFDDVYNVFGNAHLIKQVDKLPVKFGSVTGSFKCSYNNLTSLEGCPNFVGGNFHCESNNLTSLEGCPNFVGGNFLCKHNKLTSIEGFPKIINGATLCDEELRSTKEYRQYLILKKLRK